MVNTVSVILPVLNNAAGFERALKSILGQADAAALQLIVIDGGSTDGTIECINTYSEQLYYWESGRDTGIADAFNRGIKQATGDIIGILNSDDVLESDAIKNLICAMDMHPLADVYYGSIRYYDSVRQTTFIRRPDLSSMHQRMSIFHPAMFVRRNCYEKIGYYDCNYSHAMDSEWCHRAMVSQVRFCKVSSVLATMALGGLSDIEYRSSLQQYRSSIITHQLARPLAAYVYYYFFLFVKMAMRVPVMRPLKRLRDHRLAAKKR